MKHLWCVIISARGLMTHWLWLSSERVGGGRGWGVLWARRFSKDAPASVIHQLQIPPTERQRSLQLVWNAVISHLTWYTAGPESITSFVLTHTWMNSYRQRIARDATRRWTSCSCSGDVDAGGLIQSGFSQARARPLPPQRVGLTVSHSTADPATGGPRHPDTKHLLTGRQENRKSESFYKTIVIFRWISYISYCMPIIYGAI